MELANFESVVGSVNIRPRKDRLSHLHKQKFDSTLVHVNLSPFRFISGPEFSLSRSPS